MKLYNLMRVTALLAFIFGVGFILAPALSMSLYGNQLDEVGLFLGRYFGASLLGLAFLAWLNRKANSRGLVVGFFAAMVLGFVVALYDSLAGPANNLAWLNVAIYLLLGAGFGYFAFAKPA